MDHPGGGGEGRVEERGGGWGEDQFYSKLERPIPPNHHPKKKTLLLFCFFGGEGRGKANDSVATGSEPKIRQEIVPKIAKPNNCYKRFAKMKFKK